ncbi:hypothetical protein V8F20_000541 [Naviculisporaceae sp. PSN 640]
MNFFLLHSLYFSKTHLLYTKAQHPMAFSFSMLPGVPLISTHRPHSFHTQRLFYTAAQEVLVLTSVLTIPFVSLTVTSLAASALPHPHISVKREHSKPHLPISYLLPLCIIHSRILANISLLKPQATSAKKEGKAAAATDNGAANPDFALRALQEQLDQFCVEEGSSSSAVDPPPEQQQVDPGHTERRDPEEVYRFWANVRTQLWIDDDELEDPPYLTASAHEGRGETSNNYTEVAQTAKAHPDFRSSARRGTRISVPPPDSKFTPDSPFGTGPVLESIKEYHEKKEKEQEKADADPSPLTPTAAYENNPAFAAHDRRVIHPSLVPAPLRTPGREMASSPTVPNLDSGGGSPLTPTPSARIRPPHVPSQLGSSPLKASDEAIDQMLSQISPRDQQVLHSNMADMGSSPPTAASSIAGSVYSQDGNPLGSSLPRQIQQGSGHRVQIHHPTGTTRSAANERAPANPNQNPLSLDRYRHLISDEPEAPSHGNNSSQAPSRLPLRFEIPAGNTTTRNRSGSNERLHARRRTPFPARINTSLANSANPAAAAYQLEHDSPFDLLEEDEDDLDTPILPSLPQTQDTQTEAADADDDTDLPTDNRITRWPTVTVRPLRIPSNSSSNTNANANSDVDSPMPPISSSPPIPSRSQVDLATFAALTGEEWDPEHPVGAPPSRAATFDNFRDVHTGSITGTQRGPAREQPPRYQPHPQRQPYGPGGHQGQGHGHGPFYMPSQGQSQAQVHVQGQGQGHRRNQGGTIPGAQIHRGVGAPPTGPSGPSVPSAWGQYGPPPNPPPAYAPPRPPVRTGPARYHGAVPSQRQGPAQERDTPSGRSGEGHGHGRGR